MEIDAFLFARETIQEQRDFFYQSYATAESEKFLLSRDRYYWHYRSVQCLKVSAETEGAASEYPFIYCNAYNNLQSDSSVTGLCLPATCFQDKLQQIEAREAVVPPTHYRFKFHHQQNTLCTCRMCQHLSRRTRSEVKITSHRCVFGILSNSNISNDNRKIKWTKKDNYMHIWVACHRYNVGHSGTFVDPNPGEANYNSEQIGTFSFWYKFYWHRIVRLWPNLAYLLFYLPTQMAVLHYRPMWKVEDLYDACVHSWWKTLFFINSVTDNDCLPWTWYVGTDFIFYLISPIYLLSLDKSRKLGLVVSVATIATSSVLNAIAMEQFKYPPTQFIWITPSIFNPDFMEHHRTVYIKPQYRIGSHIVGILLGYYLANNKVILSRRKLYCSWLLSIILGFTSLFGLYPALQGWHWWSYHLLYGALHRTAWVIAISWIIFACHNEYASCINRFLSLSLFVYLSKASYSVFLIHLLVVGGLFIKREFPIVFNGIPATLIFVMQDIIVSHLVGFLSVFLIECPFVKIDEAIRKRQKSHKKEVEITKISEK
ncbi:unnamed protein product [Litomosoides sigmodontis]|uniref:Acyltransferase 3 domain-containing protein n=1 Tax=Litomosoides sigmodontis TaxID=42156 RepID=A0A3P6SUJ4_LITSI|nr:unnamed protein product [Litomosoides sigmodontis]